METSGEANLLRIFISSTDNFRHKPLYEVIVFAAKRYGLAGATVLKGCMGYGASSMVYSQKLWDISEKMPIIIEIVDDTVKINGFVESILPYFEKVPKGGLITLEKVSIVLHKRGGSQG
ncbi:MAG: DUF190 domain-containing protein [Bacteroidota bacterium]